MYKAFGTIALRNASPPVRFASARPLIKSAIRQYSAASPTGTVTVHKRSKWKIFKRTVQFGLLGGIGYSAYVLWDARNPPFQAPFDPEKKTIVILGSGWASTSLLKSIDTDFYNVVVVSPRNYFLFTPLLPSCTVGTIDVRSIVEPTRFITRHKSREVKVYEAECTEVDPFNKTVTISDNSEIKGQVNSSKVAYDYLVIGVGATNQTFGIKGVQEHALFLKEVWDAQKIRTRLMDCIETAGFPNQSPEEIDRLLHMVVVGGGPTGVEYAAELHDFLVEDLTTWYPELAGKLKITLIEALPNVLPAFSKQLIDYTEANFKEQNISIHTKTMVKEVHDREITVQQADGSLAQMPYGLLVWATGNTSRPVVRNLMSKFPQTQTVGRGLLVDDWLKLQGSNDIYVLGDAAASKYAPTAQVASQQGKYLARLFSRLALQDQLETEVYALSDIDEKARKLRRLEKVRNIKPFHYSHQGSLAYIGSDKAIADLPWGSGNVASGGVATYVFWRSVYLSNLFSIRNRALVATDWIKKNVLGRDISRE